LALLWWWCKLRVAELLAHAAAQDPILHKNVEKHLQHSYVLYDEIYTHTNGEHGAGRATPAPTKGWQPKCGRGPLLHSMSWSYATWQRRAR